MRPTTTLFLLMSVDGKISTGDNDSMDVDKDFPNIIGVKEGLYQYYDIEQTTDLWSFNSGRVLAKVGINNIKNPSKTEVSFVVFDNNHLNENGILNMCIKSDKFVLITTNKNHPAFSIPSNLSKNMFIILQNKIDLKYALEVLYKRFKCTDITLQTGGTLNGLFLRNKLIDYLNIVIAPILIGGRNVSTLIDGEAISSSNDLKLLSPMKLINCNVLKNSYIQLKYKII